ASVTKWTVLIAKAEGDARMGPVVGLPSSLADARLLLVIDNLHTRALATAGQPGPVYVERLGRLIDSLERVLPGPVRGVASGLGAMVCQGGRRTALAAGARAARCRYRVAQLWSLSASTIRRRRPGADAHVAGRPCPGDGHAGRRADVDRKQRPQARDDLHQR